MDSNTGMTYQQAYYEALEREAALRSQLDSWKDRFRAIVGDDSPDGAGNRVITLKAQLAAANEGINTSIVCICGSTCFKQAWIAENARLTGEGYIVLAVGLWGHHERVFPDAETKKRLDELHLRKIDLCHWVWVLDVGGYIGESTRNEIAYAEAHGKVVRYLSQEFPGYVEPIDPLVAANAAREKAEAVSDAAMITAHRVCLGVEHDPQNGKLHGCCVVCGDPWPCQYADPKRLRERAEKLEAALRRIAGELGEMADRDGDTMVEKIRFFREELRVAKLTAQDNLDWGKKAEAERDKAQRALCVEKDRMNEVRECVDACYNDSGQLKERDSLAPLIHVIHKVAIIPETPSPPCPHAARVKDAGDGAMRIVSERIRQKKVEGWTPEHDEQHENGELALAAVAYTLNKMHIRPNAYQSIGDDVWPFEWSEKWDKREKHDRERSLEIAGALIAAELDRLAAELDRLAELRRRAEGGRPPAAKEEGK